MAAQKEMKKLVNALQSDFDCYKMLNKVSSSVPEGFHRTHTKSEMEEKNGSKKPNNAGSTGFGKVTKEFTEDIDILGLKFLCRENTHLFRKLLYLVLVFFGSGFAIYQIIDQVGTMWMHIYTELGLVLFPWTWKLHKYDVWFVLIVRKIARTIFVTTHPSERREISFMESQNGNNRQFHH